MKKHTELKILFYVTLLLVLVNFPIFKYGWYVQDDYLTLEFGKSINLIEASNNIVDWLYNSQNRYQPFRLFLFTLVSFCFKEEFVILINLGLHFVNAIVAFKFLKIFHVNRNIRLLATIIFGANATWRMIESPSAMIGGDGLIFFLVFTSIYLFHGLFLNFTLNVKSIFLFSLSILLYGFAIYSYESTYPLSILYVLSLISSGKQNFFQKIKKFSILIFPYILIAITYLIYFRGVNSGYEGASINFSSDIYVRFFYYSKVLFKFGISPNYRDFIEYIFIIPLIGLFSFLLVKKFSDYAPLNKEVNNNSVLIACLIYISSISLFVLNNWQTPKDVMHHHLYVASFAASIFLANIIVYITDFRVFNIFSKSILLAFFLILSLLSISKSYKDVYKNRDLIKNIRDELIRSYDGSKYVVLDGYNNYRARFHPIMSSMDGALLVWLKNPNVQSATNPKFVAKDSVFISTPLTYYKDSNVLLNVKNNDIQIFKINNRMQAKPINFLIDDFYSPLISVEGSDVLCQNIINENKSNLIVYTMGQTFLNINFDDLLYFQNNSTLKVNNILQDKFYKTKSGQAYIKIDPSQKYAFIDIFNYSFKSNAGYSLESNSNLNDRISKEILFANMNSVNRYKMLRDIEIIFKDGFYERETSTSRRWNWSKGQGVIEVVNRSDQMLKLKVNFFLASPNAGNHTLFANGAADIQFEFTNEEKEVTFEIVIKPGSNVIKFSSDNLFKNNTDPRTLSFAVANFCVQ